MIDVSKASADLTMVSCWNGVELGCNHLTFLPIKMSSDSEPEDPRKLRATQGAMRSLFASDRKAVENGPQSLKYDPRTSAASQNAPLPGQQAQTVACQAMVVVYKGEVSIGPCFIAIMVPAGANAGFIVIVNREKKPQCRIRIDPSLQLLINETDPTFATLYDPSIQAHWMLQFKSAAEAQQFVVGTLAIQHYILLADGQGPAEPFVDLIAADTAKSAVRAANGDICHIGYKVWLVQRVGQSQLYTSGKVVEEIPPEAPKSVQLGSNVVMTGIEEGLRGATKGTRRVVVIPPRKTKSKGLQNPEIGASDSVVVCITVNSVDKAGPRDEFGMSQSDSSEAEDLVPKKKARRGRGRRAESDEDVLPPKTTAKLLGAPAALATPSPVSAAPASPVGLDTNALLHTVLLQSLQQQQKPAAAEAPAGVDVQRSIERLHYQIQSLYDKIDRIDLEKQLQNNNQAIERIVKKAVGKMPVNDVDVEDITKDRNELLALIEQLKGKNQELTDNYHKALETLGKHKDETSGLKNDLMIEREAAGQRYTELKERKRLELVDLEVRHRRELDKAQELKYEEGRSRGYDEGYNAGKIDAIQVSGSSSMEEMKQMLHKKDSENVELQSRMAQLEGRLVQERRDFKDQIEALNNLISRMEERRGAASQSVADDVTAQTKRIRRVMNSLYASVEEQFYATESESIGVGDALAMLLVSVKTETRSAVDEIKNEAAIRESSDKSTRNEVVDAYTIAAAEMNKGIHRRSKHDGAPDVTKDTEDPASDLDTLRRELEEFESRRQANVEEVDNLQGERMEISAPEFPAGGWAGEVEDFDFSSLPTDGDQPVRLHHSDDAIPKVFPNTYSQPDLHGDVDHTEVPEIPFE